MGIYEYIAFCMYAGTKTMLYAVAADYYTTTQTKLSFYDRVVNFVKFHHKFSFEMYF